MSFPYEDKHTFNGMDVCVLDDHDKKLDGIPWDCMASDGNKFYVRESFWLKIKDKLIEVTKNVVPQ